MEVALPKQSRDPKPRRSPLRAPRIGLFALLALGVVLIISFTKPQCIQFSAETSVEFLGVTIGTNAYIHGNPLEKLLGDRIPAPGLSLGPFKLQRPRSYPVNTDGAPLAARILIRGPDKQFGEWFADDLKVIAANNSGRQLENPDPLRHPFASNEVLLTLPLFAFPRDERNVRLRFSPSKRGSVERRWLEFTFPNPLRQPPFRQPPAEWKATALPLTNVATGGQFILHQQLSDPTRFMFLLPSKDWLLTECKIHDPEGNFHRGQKVDAYFSDFRTVMRFPHSLERDRVWKVTATFVAAMIQFSPGYDIAQTDSDQDLRFQIAANTQLTLTNSAGTTYSCAFDGHTLSIKNATNHAEKTYFFILSATDHFHRDVHFASGFERSLPFRMPLGGQTVNMRLVGLPIHPESQTWNMLGRPGGPPATNISLHLVAPKRVETAFYINPAH